VDAQHDEDFIDVLHLGELELTEMLNINKCQTNKKNIIPIKSRRISVECGNAKIVVAAPKNTEVEFI